MRPLLVVLLCSALGCARVGGLGDSSDAGDPPGSGDPSGPPADAGPSSSRQTARTVGFQGAPNGFYEYLPPGYPDGKARPLLVFWHGLGENGNGGSELSRVVANGPPKLVARDRWPAERPFLVLSPQHKADGGCPSAAEIDAFLAWAIGHYDVDAKRIFLTGLSCGAIGSWSYLGAHRGELVAAALLIAGDPGDPSASWSVWGRNGCALGEVAIASVHGDADPTVNIANDRATMEKLVACPTPPARGAKWTAVAGGGHDTWSATYDCSRGDVYAWLLEHPKP